MRLLDKVIEVGQRGLTKLFRLEDDTVDIFAEAENFDPESGFRTIDVDANGFGVLYRDSPERFLHTFNVNVCNGIALACPEEDFYALVHLYSNRSHYTVNNAQAAIENHARVAWERFEGFLPPHMKFNAVSFGGKDRFPGIPQREPTPGQIRRYYKGPDQIADSATDTEENQVLGQMAFTASKWLADAFYEAALDSGKIAEHQDVRYTAFAHHVLIDKQSKKIYFGKVGDGLNKKIIAHTEKRGGGFLFPHLGITRAPATAPRFFSESPVQQTISPAPTVNPE